MTATHILAALILFSLSAPMKAQSASPYDISDPRNPDCPCHKHQQLADEEYKKFMSRKERETKDPGRSGVEIPGSDAFSLRGSNRQIVAFNSNATQGGSFDHKAGELKHQSKLCSRQHKRKIRHIRYPSWLRKIACGAKDFCRESRLVAACYTWR